MQIGERLKQLRKENGLSLAKMSKKTKIHKVCIMAWERGDRCPSFNNLKKLCKTLNVSLSTFDKCSKFVKRVPKRRLTVTFDDWLSQWRVLCRERVAEGWKQMEEGWETS